jgi:hypothetical protein
LARDMGELRYLSLPDAPPLAFFSEFEPPA